MLHSRSFTSRPWVIAVAGLIVTADIKAADVNNTGLYMELDAILARGVAPEATLVAKAVIIVALCLLQSPPFRALFVRRRAA